MVISEINSFRSKAWANDLLRYAIKVLRGQAGIGSRPLGLLHIALILKDELEEAGFWWQVQVLNYWIHRFQGGEFTEPERSEGSDSERSEGGNSS